ncbi:hypothetical protein RCL1_008254 [Eukaryota sp. TZLM3-RCL]
MAKKKLPVLPPSASVPDTVPAVASAPVETASVVSVVSFTSTESEEDLSLPIYSPVTPFLVEEFRGRSGQEFTSIPREWLLSLTELANQGVDMPSLLRSTDPVQVGASVAPVEVTHPSRSHTRSSSSVSSRIARLKPG